MTVVTPIFQETDLVGTVVNSSLSTTGLSVQVKFLDNKTGAARTPQATTLVFTINKEFSNSETILADSHSTASGVTTITINASGRALPKFGSGAGSGTGNSHEIGSKVGCVNIARTANVLNNIVNGTNGTGGSSLKIGDETAQDTTITAQNDQTVKPKIYFDDSNESQLKGHRGDDEGAAGDFSIGHPQLTTAERDALTSPLNGMSIYNTTTGVTNFREGGAWVANASGASVADAADNAAGKVDIASAAEIAAGTATDAISGAINVIPVSQTVKTSSGAGDENKLPVLDSSGKLATGFVDTSALTAKATLTAKGSIYAASAASTPAELAVGSNGKVLVADSAEATGLNWASRSKRLATVSTAVNTFSTNTAQTLLSVTVPGGTLGTNKGIRVRIYADSMKYFSATYTQLFAMKYGGSTIVSRSLAGIAATTLDIGIEFVLLADGATNVQRGLMRWLGSSVENSNFNSAGGNYVIGTDSGTGAIDSTIDKTLLIEVTNSNSTADTGGTFYAVAEIITD